jgi:hypothetical protein
MIMSTKFNKLQGLVVLTYNSSFLGGGGRRILSSRPTPGKVSKTHHKNKIKT